MRVQIFDDEAGTHEECDLTDAFPDWRGDPEYWDVLNRLVNGESGCYVGGGASPLVYITLA